MLLSCFNHACIGLLTIMHCSVTRFFDDLLPRPILDFEGFAGAENGAAAGFAGAEKGAIPSFALVNSVGFSFLLNKLGVTKFLKRAAFGVFFQSIFKGLHKINHAQSNIHYYRIII